MASKLAKKIGEITECSICNQKFEKPKHLLPCLHVFCQACIEEWAKRKVRNGVFPCPLCKCNVNISRQGIQTFPDSFLTKDLMESLESSTKSLVSCDIHPSTTIIMYCKDCEVWICNNCLPFHPKHLLKSINTQREEVEEEITIKIKEGEGKKKKLYKRREEIVVDAKDLGDQSSEMVNQFADIMNGVINKVNAITSKEHTRQVTNVDKWLKELQDLMNQCGNNPGFEDSVPEYMARKETLKKLDEAVGLQRDTNVHVRVQVKMKDDIDVDNVFNHCFTVEKVQYPPRLKTPLCEHVSSTPGVSAFHETKPNSNVPKSDEHLDDRSKLMKINPENWETQKSVISELLRTQLKRGDTWYLVDTKWFKQWKLFVGYDTWDTSLAGDDNANPGPIDNSPLLKEGASEGTLRENLVDERDYTLVPTDAWNKLVQWYGIAKEHYTIARKVIDLGMFTSQARVEVYPVLLKLCNNSNPEAFKIHHFSRAATIYDMEKEMRKIFNIDRTKEVRLWNEYMRNTYEHLNKPQNTVQDADLYHGQVIVIEQRNEDGSWPRQLNTATTS